MGAVQIIDKADHDIMFEAERPSHTPLVREFCTRKYFISAHAGLPSIGLAVDGKCIGGVYMDCGFIHISVLPEYQGKCSLVYGQGLAWAFKHADPIYAEISEGNSKCIRFAEHSGWEKVGSYGCVVYYRSTKKLKERIDARHRRQLSAQALAGNMSAHPRELNDL